MAKATTSVIDVESGAATCEHCGLVSACLDADSPLYGPIRALACVCGGETLLPEGEIAAFFRRAGVEYPQSHPVAASNSTTFSTSGQGA